MRIWGLMLVLGTPLAAGAECLEVLETAYEESTPINGYAEVAWAATVENQCEASHDAYLDFRLQNAAGDLLAKDLAAVVVEPGQKEITGSVHLPERDLEAANNALAEVSGRERPR